MLKKLTIILFATLFLLYIAVCVFIYLNQTKMIFYPQPLNNAFASAHADKSFTLEFIEDTSEKIHLSGWIQAQDPKAPFVLYFGGNAEEVSNKIEYFNYLGITNYLLVNYRSYGESTGFPNEANLKKDALTLYDYLRTEKQIPAERIVLFGTSLGSGIATYVASQRAVSKVILNTPYDSIVNVAKQRMPYLPINSLAHQRFDSIALAPSITAPLLCLIAQDDQVIPPAHAQALCAKWRGEVTERVIPNVGHNTILQHEVTKLKIWEFINM